MPVYSGNTSIPGIASFSTLGQTYTDGVTTIPTGLYETGGVGTNAPPASHNTTLLNVAKRIKPRNTAGQASASGKIVVCRFGVSNQLTIGDAVASLCLADTLKSSKVEVLNISKDGQTIDMIADLNSQHWVYQGVDTIPMILEAKGVAIVGDIYPQVQAVVLGEPALTYGSNASNPSGWPTTLAGIIAFYKEKLQAIAQIFRAKFPNCYLFMVTSPTYRAYGGRYGVDPVVSKAPSELQDWMSFAGMRAFVTANMDADDGYAPCDIGAWAMGPYVLSNGTTPNPTVLYYENGTAMTTVVGDMTAPDGVHPTSQMDTKCATRELEFYQETDFVKSWYLANP